MPARAREWPPAPRRGASATSAGMEPRKEVSPGLRERARLDLEGPGGPILADEVERDRGDAVGLHEEAVRLVLEPLARAGQIHHAVDDDEGDVDALGPERSRHRFRQQPLRSL